MPKTITPVEDPALWETAPIATLVKHLVEAHRRWREQAIPELNRTAERLLRGDYSPKADQLRTLLDRLSSALEVHTRLEERVLFPAIVEMDRCRAAAIPFPRMPFGSLRNPILMMNGDHDEEDRQWEAAEALARGLADGGELLLRLANLRKEVAEHGRLESGVLFPRALALET